MNMRELMNKVDSLTESFDEAEVAQLAQNALYPGGEDAVERLEQIESDIYNTGDQAAIDRFDAIKDEADTQVANDNPDDFTGDDDYYNGNNRRHKMKMRQHRDAEQDYDWDDIPSNRRFR